jgi:hypothetical protein
VESGATTKGTNASLNQRSGGMATRSARSPNLRSGQRRANCKLMFLCLQFNLLRRVYPGWNSKPVVVFLAHPGRLNKCPGFHSERQSAFIGSCLGSLAHSWLQKNPAKHISVIVVVLAMMFASSYSCLLIWQHHSQNTRHSRHQHLFLLHMICP